MHLNNIIISMQSDVTERGKLTGDEGGLLRVQVSPTLNREHLDWVAGACCQVGKLVGQISFIQIFCQFFVLPDHQTVMADVTRPG